MRRRILFALSSIFLLFAAGAATSVLYIQNITGSLHRLLALHRVEDLRHDLVVRLQTVQSDFYRVGTPLEEDLDRIVDNVAVLDSAATRCASCHHQALQAAQIQELRHLVGRYKEVLSYYITAAANPEHVASTRAEAATVGAEILRFTELMTLSASQSLQRITSRGLQKIEQTRVILVVTVGLALVLAAGAAVYLTRFVTRPVKELLEGTRAIERGQFGYSIPYRDRTEFGELAEKFNAMSATLRQNHENLAEQQRELQESERKFRTISEFTQDWEYWIEEGGRIVFMSPSCKGITGYAQDEFVAVPGLLAEIVHPEDRGKYDEHLRGFRLGHHEFEFRILTRDGATRWISHACGPMEADGRFLGRRVSNRDITDRKRLEEQLLQAQKMESLGLMAGGVAHDFNNLLTVILGGASMLQNDECSASPRARRNLERILEASEKARQLTSTLLAFSRKQVMRQEQVDLNDVLRETASLVERIIGEDVELQIRPADSPLPIFADRHQLGHALMNLATNARDAMPEGGRLEIAVALEKLDEKAAARLGVREGRYARIDVRDTGTGIDPRHVPHIFEPFFTTKEKGKGTGLGLSTAFGIVHQHGGAISVETQADNGTVFRIYLPETENEAPREAVERKPQPPPLEAVGRPTILLAEDEESVRNFIREVLEENGYRVIAAVDGQDAMEKFDANRSVVDLALVDLVMPRRNGRQVYDHLRQTSPAARVIFMSGYTQDILTSRGIAEAGLNFLPKPIAVTDLLYRVRTAMADPSAV